MSTLTDVPTGKTKREIIEQAVIRFSGDSGDGMQITGSQFTNTVALYGNDMATFPDYPAEIRAPAGTVPGVSGFPDQFFFARSVHTPGRLRGRSDRHESRGAENQCGRPEAQRHPDRQFRRIPEGDLRKAQLTTNPLEDHSLDELPRISRGTQRLTRAALQHLGIDAKAMDRCKNFFALGMCYWLYNRSMEPTVRWIEDKFKKKPLLAEANSWP